MVMAMAKSNWALSTIFDPQYVCTNKWILSGMHSAYQRTTWHQERLRDRGDVTKLPSAEAATIEKL